MDDEDDDPEDTPIVLPREVSSGPLDLDAALADPAGFVAGMTETRTLGVWVPLTTSDFLTQHPACNGGLFVEAYRREGVDGTIVRTTDHDLYEALIRQFHQSNP